MPWCIHVDLLCVKAAFFFVFFVFSFSLSFLLSRSNSALCGCLLQLLLLLTVASAAAAAARPGRSQGGKVADWEGRGEGNEVNLSHWSPGWGRWGVRMEEVEGGFDPLKTHSSPGSLCPSSSSTVTAGEHKGGC